MIRSLTIGLPLDVLSTTEIERAVKEVLGVASMELDRNSLSPRTVRFTLPPVGQDGETDGALLSRLRWVDELAASEGVRWFCCPVDLVAFGSSKVRLPAILDGLLRFDRMFANLILAQDGRIAVNALYEAAKLVLNLSLKSNNGFDNFRLGASFNCPANAPFFPFSRHDGDMVSFSFALETTQLAHQTLDAMGERPEPALARDRLVEALVPPLKRVDELGRSIARVTGTEYKGLDASLAPMPVDDVSVAGLVERLTGVSVGSHSTLFATALLTDSLRTAIAQSGVASVGFNGVMYSLLEDPVLAAANNKRLITVDTLHALSSVCACGLDMIPVPGLTFPEEISALMLDTAALSSALRKPLGVRLLPIPQGHVNEYTKFNLDFLCDSRIVALTSNDRRLVTTDELLEFHTPR